MAIYSIGPEKLFKRIMLESRSTTARGKTNLMQLAPMFLLQVSGFEGKAGADVMH